jgi:hypothetical protein
MEERAAPEDLRKFALYPESVCTQKARRDRHLARTTWYVKEKFAGTKTPYWDTLFGAEIAE